MGDMLLDAEQELVEANTEADEWRQKHTTLTNCVDRPGELGTTDFRERGDQSPTMGVDAHMETQQNCFMELVAMGTEAPYVDATQQADEAERSSSVDSSVGNNAEPRSPIDDSPYVASAEASPELNAVVGQFELNKDLKTLQLANDRALQQRVEAAEEAKIVAQEQAEDALAKMEALKGVLKQVSMNVGAIEVAEEQTSTKTADEALEMMDMLEERLKQVHHGPLAITRTRNVLQNDSDTEC